MSLELSGNRLAALCCQLEVADIAGTSMPSVTTSKSRVLRYFIKRPKAGGEPPALAWLPTIAGSAQMLT